MEKVDFIKLAEYCRDEFKEQHNKQNNYYVSTLYVSISDDNVITSQTPHILENAQKCILIHTYSALVVSNFYHWYKVECIDSTGCVTAGYLDDEFRLSIAYFGNYNNQEISLKDETQEYYRSNSGNWPIEIVKIWKLYSKLREVKTGSERKLIANLFEKDEAILDLEKQIEDVRFSKKLLEQERNQYKTLLDEIKGILNDNVEK